MEGLPDDGPSRTAFDAECVRWVRVTARILRLSRQDLNEGKHRILLQAQAQRTITNLKSPEFVVGNIMYAMEGLLEMFGSTLLTLEEQKMLYSDRVVANYEAAFLGHIEASKPKPEAP